MYPQRNVPEAALVIHGGTIMNLMEEYADIQKPFYEWHVKNGGGYEVVLDEESGRMDERVIGEFCDYGRITLLSYKNC
ncbi:MAG: hypothetical protein ACLUTA_17505 [Blautia wexlerae]